MSTESTKANSEESIAPSGSVGIFFGELGHDRTEGEGTERTVIHKVPDIWSHVTTLPAATEVISHSQLEGSKTTSLITEDTLATKGTFF